MMVMSHLFRLPFFLSLVFCALGKTQVDGTRESLIYSDRKLLNQLFLEESGSYSKRAVPLDKSSRNILFVDYDPTTDFLYWTEIFSRSIQRAHPDGSDLETVLHDPQTSIEGIAIDWVSQNLYYVDTENPRILVLGLRDRVTKVIVSKDLENPRAIQVDPVKGYLFWTDWGKETIERSFLDGTGRDVIVDSELRWPNGLAIDRVGGWLYWVDGGADHVGMVKYDGQESRTLLELTGNHLFDVTIMGDYLYWSSWMTRSIEKVNRFTGQGREVVASQINGGPMGLVALMPEEANNAGSNLCAVRNGFCESLCLYRPPPLKPQCVEGDKKGHTEAPNVDKLLLITSTKSLSYVSLDEKAPLAEVPVSTDSISPLFVDYHHGSGMIYYTDRNDNDVKKTSLDGSGREEVFKVEAGPEGLAIDWVSGNLYWSVPSQHKICVSLLNGSFPIDVVTGLSEPRAIGLDPANGYIYWTDWGVPSIEKSFLDGSGRTPLVTTDLGFPNGLAVDLEEGRLYWGDGKTDRIETCDLDGSDRKVIVSLVHHVFGLSLLDGFIYWSDWYTRSVERANKATGEERLIVQHSRVQQHMGVKAVDLNSPPTGNNTCGANNGGCSHICLYRPSPLTTVCACPNGTGEVHYINAEGIRGICIQYGEEPFPTGPSSSSGRVSTSSSDIQEVSPGNDTNASTKCAPNETACLSGDPKACIPLTSRCDGDADCSDGSDEMDCQSLTCPPLFMFDCRTGSNKCIPLRWKCDGKFDCVDGFDEENCDSSYTTSSGANTTEPIDCAAYLMGCIVRNRSLCVPAGWRCDGRKDCDDGSDEMNCDPPQTTSTAVIAETTAYCPPGTSRCPTGVPTPCIHLGSRCDGDADCSDGSDEMDCQSLTCPPLFMFACRTGSKKKCIPLIWKCDGEFDCVDGFDEENCDSSYTTSSGANTTVPIDCASDMMGCIIGDMGACIPEGWRCDGRKDCDDGSDEMNCDPPQTTSTAVIAETTASCPPGTSRCPTGVPKPCIHLAWVCDGDVDCSDGSDEMDCQSRTCPPSNMACRTGSQKCIPLRWKCDGEFDCVDGFDEENCDSSHTTSSAANTTVPIDCASDMMGCIIGDMGACIPEGWRCDGENDCDDGSDETNCDPPQTTGTAVIAETTSSCPSGTTRCPTSDPKACIPLTSRCDGDVDCSDGSDEMDCQSRTCPPSTMACRTGSHKCIPLLWRCDGLDDCADGSDEEDCNVIHLVCDQDSIKCISRKTNKSSCIPLRWRCDGAADCLDQSDEKDCAFTSPKTTQVSSPPAEASCPLNTMACVSWGNDSCVPSRWLCDGQEDCDDGLDEKSCEISTCPPITMMCLKGGRKICVYLSYRCDGDWDCDDGLDEENCDIGQTKEYNISQDGFNTTALNFNKINMHSNRTNLNINSTNLGFNTSNSNFSRTNLNLNHTNLGLNRTNSDFNKTNSEFNRTNLGSNRTNLDITKLGFNKTDLMPKNANVADVNNTNNLTKEEILMEEEHVCPCGQPQTSDFLVNQFCLAETTFALSGKVKRIEVKDGSLVLHLRRRKQVYKSVEWAGVGGKIVLNTGSKSCACVDTIRRRHRYLLMGKVEGDKMAATYVIPGNSAGFREGVKAIQRTNVCFTHFLSLLNDEMNRLSSDEGL